MASRPTRLLLVDEHQVVRIGMAALFATVPSVEIVGEAASVAEGLSAAHRLRPELALLDVRLPDGSGVDLCRRLRAELPATRAVMVTSSDDEATILDAIAAGADGYVLKDAGAERVIQAVEAVAQGRAYMDPAVTRTALGWIRSRRGGSRAPAARPLVSELTEQQRRMLPLIATGKTNREIAQELHLSEHTVKTYISELLRTLGLRRRSEAAAFFATS
jgi:DNA-binding NarL/FixJ family response regulator